jgi:dihydrofolate reductase
VADLNRRQDGNLAILGSGELVRSLAAHKRVDEYSVLIHPIVLESGRRLFDDAVFAVLRLVRSVTTSAGVIIATYQPAEPRS